MNISLRLTPDQAEAIARVVFAARKGKGAPRSAGLRACRAAGFQPASIPLSVAQEDHAQALDTLAQIVCQAAFHRALIGKADCKTCVKVLEIERQNFTPARRTLARRRGNCGP